MENREIARVLSETADLMEIAGEDSFRIRSYRNGATAIEGYPERVTDILRNPERKVTEIAGIGKGLAAALQEVIAAPASVATRCSRSSRRPRSNF
jgi:DNA polymerase (family X)